MSRKPTSGDNAVRKKIACLGAGIIVVLLGLVLSSSYRETAGARAATTPDIAIGIVGPMSGDMAELGRYVREAVELQTEEWNGKGGLLRRRIRLLVEDDYHDPKEAVAAAKRLVRAKVWGVIGHLTSAASLPASGVYNAAGIPQITPSSTDPRLTEQGFRSLFRTCGRDDQQGQVAARFVLDAFRPKRVVVLHDQTVYGKALADTFRRHIMWRDRRLPTTTLTLSPGGKNIASVIEAIKAKKPDIIYFGGIYREGGLLVRQLREHGIKATFVSGDGVIGAEFISLAGDAAAGTYLTFAPNPLRLPSAERVIKKFQDRHGTIGPYSLYAYDAAGTLFTAIARAKPKAPTRPELLRVSQVLHRMTYMGAFGMLRWDQKGDLVHPPYVIYQTRKGGSFQGWFEQVTGLPPQPRG